MSCCLPPSSTLSVSTVRPKLLRSKALPPYSSCPQAGTQKQGKKNRLHYNVKIASPDLVQKLSAMPVTECWENRGRQTHRALVRATPCVDAVGRFQLQYVTLRRKQANPASMWTRKQPRSPLLKDNSYCPITYQKDMDIYKVSGVL